MSQHPKIRKNLTLKVDTVNSQFHGKVYLVEVHFKMTFRLVCWPVSSVLFHAIFQMVGLEVTATVRVLMLSLVGKTTNQLSLICLTT